MTDALNLSKLAKYFSDEDAARALLEEMRWGKGGAVCPHCGGADPYKLQREVVRALEISDWEHRKALKALDLREQAHYRRAISGWSR
jgi:hypothetical protein